MRGPGTTAQQIESLREKLTEGDIENANSIRDEYPPDVIALAFKLTRADVKKKLPKSIVNLISKLPDEEGDAMRARLLEIQK